MDHGPAVPAYILRGHEAPVHVLHFYSDNSLLVSGDSDGWLVIWSLSSKRPVAVWRAHNSGILQIQHWTNRRIISHGRDHKLRVWQAGIEDLHGMSTTLPNAISGAEYESVQPWLLHSLSVSALNFCAFAMCDDEITRKSTEEEVVPQLIATPHGLDSGGIDIFQLPSEKRVSQITSEKGNSTGMVMAVSLFCRKTESSRLELILAAGYEDGRVMVHIQQGNINNPVERGSWYTTMTSKPHAQPILSLALLPSKTSFLTSSTDSIITKLSLADLSTTSAQNTHPEKSMNTKHAGQQGLSIRSDGKIFATAGWDGRIRVYSCKTMKELAVLKWHKVGVYSTAFAQINGDSRSSMQQDESLKQRASAPQNTSTELTKPANALDVIRKQREDKARLTHWLAAGGKDGKISLWDIY